MKFQIEHTFEGITVPEYEALYLDEPFGVAMCESVKLGRDLLRSDRTEGRVIRHVRVTPDRDIPGPLQKILGGATFAYVEELDFELGKARGKWRSIPSLMPDKVDSSGTIEMLAVPGGVKRVVKGEIKVGVFGIGGIVEKFVVGEVERSYEDAAVFTSKWIAANSQQKK
jgi:hypothetical protein